jgi:hypothetical protein
MTDLERRALARLPLTPAEVQAIDADNDPARYPSLKFVRTLRRLCESHERLRMELQGAESVIEDLQRGVGEARRVLGETSGDSDD